MKIPKKYKSIIRVSAPESPTPSAPESPTPSAPESPPHRPNNKRVAGILYGQPRFLEETHKSIKQEFEIDGVKTDYFYHAWNQLGYGLEQQHKNENINLEKNKLTELYNKLYSPLAGEVTDNIEQSEIISNVLLSTKKTLIARKTESLNWELYSSGQFYSLQKAFEYLDSYVKKTRLITM